jgi:hypothetical protein
MYFDIRKYDTNITINEIFTPFARNKKVDELSNLSIRDIICNNDLKGIIEMGIIPKSSFSSVQPQRLVIMLHETTSKQLSCGYIFINVLSYGGCTVPGKKLFNLGEDSTLADCYDAIFLP